MGHESILHNQKAIISCVDLVEKEIRKVQNSVRELESRQVTFEKDLDCLNSHANEINSCVKDAALELDRPEQYSRKSSVRIHNVIEFDGENVREVVISHLKTELNVEITASEIDIVHPVGRHFGKYPCAILVKFLSHKWKEHIMKKKKEAKCIKIAEDPARGIKRMLNEINANCGPLNIERVWIIGGRIKYKHFKDSFIHEVRSYNNFFPLTNSA